MKEMEGDGNFANAYDSKELGKKIKGPLSRSIFTSDESLDDKFGNTLIFAFAGHDTTGTVQVQYRYMMYRRLVLYSTLL